MKKKMIVIISLLCMSISFTVNAQEYKDSGKCSIPIQEFYVSPASTSSSTSTSTSSSSSSSSSSTSTSDSSVSSLTTNTSNYSAITSSKPVTSSQVKSRRTVKNTKYPVVSVPSSSTQVQNSEQDGTEWAANPQTTTETEESTVTVVAVEEPQTTNIFDEMVAKVSKWVDENVPNGSHNPFIVIACIFVAFPWLLLILLALLLIIKYIHSNQNKT